MTLFWIRDWGLSQKSKTGKMKTLNKKPFQQKVRENLAERQT